MAPRRVARSFLVLSLGVGLAAACGDSSTSSSDNDGSSSGGHTSIGGGDSGGTAPDSSVGGDSSNGLGSNSSSGGHDGGGGGSAASEGGTNGSSGISGSDSGSESGGGTNCGTVSPCGGNVLGTWRVIDSCAGGIVIDPISSCSASTATIQTTSFTVTGSRTFNADMTYQASETQSVTESFQIPVSCLQQTCDQYTAAFHNAGDTGSCISTSAGCNCTWGLTQTATVSGMYTVSGSMYFVDTSGVPIYYCVQGTTLHLMPQQGGSDYDIVAQKQ